MRNIKHMYAGKPAKVLALCQSGGHGSVCKGSNNLRLDKVIFIMLNTLRPRQDGRHFPDDNFKCTFLNENVSIRIKISLKFVPKGPINNIPAMVKIMAWRRPGDKPLSEPVMVSLPTHICVTRPQWVNQQISILLNAWASKDHYDAFQIRNILIKLRFISWHYWDKFRFSKHYLTPHNIR